MRKLSNEKHEKFILRYTTDSKYTLFSNIAIVRIYVPRNDTNKPCFIITTFVVE